LTGLERADLRAW